MASNLHERSAADLLALLRTGGVTSAALLEVFLARVELLNPQVNAVAVLDATYARAQAAKCDALLCPADGSAGRLAGPLHGLPLTIKNWAECDTMSGDGDVMFRQLEAAGAVVFGRTNAPTAASDVRAGASAVHTPGPGAYYNSQNFNSRSVLSTPPRRFRN